MNTNRTITLSRFLDSIGIKDENGASKNGDTPLIYSIWLDKFDIFTELISRGVDVNTKCEFGTTPLHAAVEKERLQMIEVLLRVGARTDLKDEMGYTALDMAIGEKHRSIKNIFNEF